MTTDDQPFKVGDIVRLKMGRSPIRVMEVAKVERAKVGSNRIWKKFPDKVWAIRFTYVSQLDYVARYGTNYDQEPHRWRIASDFVLIEKHKENEVAETEKLYLTKEGSYGKFLTHDSQGRAVLEMKGSGNVQAFKPEDLEEVVPYTICITESTVRPDRRPDQIHIVVAKGSTKRGDLLIGPSGVYRVSEIDTKCRKAINVSGEWRKMVTEPFLVGDAVVDDD